MERIGVVVIGRNEGDRLRECLASLADFSSQLVYVDSGSTDGSQDLARDLGAEVVSLDMSQPFTAARARNAGYERLLARAIGLEFVQFVDGDCRVAEGWIESAAKELENRPDVAIVCGRRRERDPQRSVYNLLCDMEWNTPVGEADECGGDALVRASALGEVNGYDPCVIAGEEPELCVRLRERGWKILRIEAEMTLHDAAMTRYRQWWKRTVRSGHALAERAALHGAGPFRDCVKQRRSTLFWGCAVPLAWLALLTESRGWPNLLLLGYPVLAWKISCHRRRAGDAPRIAWRYAFFTIMGKFPQMQGLILYYWNRCRGRNTAIIEYKAPAAEQPGELSRGCA
jgi:GT2 family glycosyltransferase